MAKERPVTIALIAHDGKKDSMVAFAETWRDALKGMKIIATGTTGGRVGAATGLPVHRLLSGPMGGDAQIAALVATGQCDAVVFLVDPLTAHPHEPDIQGLLRVCNVHDVPAATNIAAAGILVAALSAPRARL
jgi:methylglyoxal synthase